MGATALATSPRHASPAAEHALDPEAPMRSHRTALGTLTLLGALTVLGALTACSEDFMAPGEPLAAPDPSLATASTGSGFPSGTHYSLNIIGVPKGKSADMTGGSGHRIFVNLEGNTKINLSNADLSDGTFRVLDANGTDGNGAAFQLPSPDPENDGITSYSVYARALGKPGSADDPNSSTTTGCYDDVQTGERFCSVESMVLVREKGKSTGENVSRDLLYVYADTDHDATTAPVRVPLFSDALDSYFWSYENGGLKLAQLRFYLRPTNAN